MPRLKRSLIKTQLLILDDFGIGGVANSVGPILLDIIDQQSSNGSLIITSQFPTSKWHDFFGDPTVADAILDRIVHRSQVLNLEGGSMRKVKNSKIVISSRPIWAVFFGRHGDDELLARGRW